VTAAERGSLRQFPWRARGSTSRWARREFHIKPGSSSGGLKSARRLDRLALPAILQRFTSALGDAARSETDRIRRSVGKEQIVKRDRTIKKRQKLARYVERAAVPERPFIRGPRYLVQPSVTAACAPSLRAIAATLRDETHPVDDASLKAVWTWLTDGTGPFFGRDSAAALREIVLLENAIDGAETAVFDEERIAVAV
jgi:hypothetical protein